MDWNKPIFGFLLFIILFFATTQPTKAESIKIPVSSARFSSGIEDPYLTDRRVTVLYSFLDSYNSPLKYNTVDFVREADVNQLDWRLVASISGVESTFGKQLPYNSYNAWGWGIYGDNMIRFASYDEAIATISKSLREKYIDTWGAQNVYQIGRFYAASPTWAQRVIFFMNKIESTDELPITI